MQLNRRSDTLEVFNIYSNTVSDIKVLVFSDILNAIDELSCRSFRKKFFRNLHVERYGNLLVFGNEPPFNVFTSYIEVFQGQFIAFTIDFKCKITGIFNIIN